MSAKKIRVGFVGSAPEGSWTSQSHIPALKSLPQIELTAICTTRQESAEANAAQLGIPHAFWDPNEMARCPDVDAIAVSVKVPSHYTPVMAALNAGKHVFCEWPLGNGVAEAIEMHETAKRKGVLHMVGLQAHHSPVLNYLKDLIADGYLGRVLSCTILSSRGGLRRETVPPNKAWQVERSAGMSTLMNGHTIDAIRYCLGDFAEISAVVTTRFPQRTVIGTDEVLENESADQVAVTGVLRSGAVAVAHVRDGTYCGSGILFEINGTEGDLVVSYPAAAGIQFADIRLRGAQRGTGGSKPELKELMIPASYRWVPASIPAGPPLNVAQGYSKFASAISNGDKGLLPDFGVAVELHHFLDAVQAASDSGKKVTL